jgi:arginyl-tRNA synthetase
MKRALLRNIEDSLKRIGVEDIPPIEIEIPSRESFGDLSTPVAMSLAGTMKKAPGKIAQEIVNAFVDTTRFQKIEVAGPGFINFTFSATFCADQLKMLLEHGKDFLRENVGQGKRVQIEFISANPTGPLHLGHGRGGATGEALSNILSAAGYEVIREYYINDAGRQVRLLGHSVYARYKELLGKEYPFPDDGYRGDYVEELARTMVQQYGDRYLQNTFDEVSALFIENSYRSILKGIESDLKDFGINFDVWQSEKELYDRKEVVTAISDLREKGLVYEQDGATWFRASAFGDDKDRVIVKQNGEYTYFTSDIAYHRKKVEQHYDTLIDIWGADHHGYIPRIEAIIEALGYEKRKLKVILVQMVSLLRGGKPVQMSKRAGEFITLKEVIDEVGADITKFIFLTRRPDSHLDFDLEVAKAQSAENPVFYVQYANARIHSVFAHAHEKGFSVTNLSEADLALLLAPEEQKIIKKLLFYPMVFEAAARAYEPHRITFYLQELAGLFHPYYNKHRIVADPPSLTHARLALCRAIQIVLEEGFAMLGISAPEKM